MAAVVLISLFMISFRPHVHGIAIGFWCSWWGQGQELLQLAMVWFSQPGS